MIECLGLYNLINYHSRKNEGLVHLYIMDKDYIGLRINSISFVIFNKYLNKKHDSSLSSEDQVIIIPLHKIIGCVAFPYTSTYDHDSFIINTIDPVKCFSLITANRTFDLIAENDKDLYKIYNFSIKNIYFISLLKWMENNGMEIGVTIDLNNKQQLFKIFKDYILEQRKKTNVYPQLEKENIYNWFKRLKNYNFDLII